MVLSCGWIDTVNPEYRIAMLNSFGAIQRVQKCKSSVLDGEVLRNDYDEATTDTRTPSIENTVHPA